MKRIACLAVLACLGACHDSDGSNAVDAQALASDLIQNRTTESEQPVEVNGVNLVFPEQPGAFDGVLPADDGAVVEQ